MYKKVFILIVVLLLTKNSDCMSKQQLKNSLKVIKKSCMQKNAVTEAQVGSISQGVFVEDREVMCYMACVYKMTQVVKNGKLNYELTMRQIDIMYPPELKEPGKAAANACASFGSMDDLCEASFYVAKCLYEFDPKSFIFA